MSVINQMLKDLEKRQQPVVDETDAAMVSPTLDYQKPSSNRSKVLLWSVLSLCLGCGLTYGAMNWNDLTGAILVADETEKNGQSQTPTSLTVNNSGEDTDNVQLPIDGIASTVSASEPQPSLDETDKVDLSDGKDDLQIDTEQSQVLVSTDNAEQEPSQMKGVTAKATIVLQAESRGKELPTSNSGLSETQALVKVKTKVQEEELPPQMTITPVVLNKAQRVAKEMQKADALESQGVLGQAMQVYRNVLKHEPEQHSARKKLAALLYGQSRFNQAKQILEQGYLLYPEQQTYLLLLARVYLAGNDAVQAMATLDKMKDAGPEAKQKWLQISVLAQKQQNFSKAEEAFRQLAIIEPNQGRWWMGYAFALDSQQDYAKALGVYQQAIASQNLSAQSRQFVENRIQVLGDYQ